MRVYIYSLLASVNVAIYLGAGPRWAWLNAGVAYFLTLLALTCAIEERHHCGRDTIR